MAPQGLFKNFTDDQLAKMGERVADWLLNGQWTSNSGAGKSGSKNYLTPERAAVEYNYELSRRAKKPRVSSVLYQVPNHTIAV